jgi:hypothetical protein
MKQKTARLISYVPFLGRRRCVNVEYRGRVIEVFGGEYEAEVLERARVYALNRGFTRTKTFYIVGDTFYKVGAQG